MVDDYQMVVGWTCVWGVAAMEIGFVAGVSMLDLFLSSSACLAKISLRSLVLSGCSCSNFRAPETQYKDS